MNSVFLGGMLSMSSTTIIIKAFDDLGLRSQRFTGIVFGTLVVEDLIAILMMVILSTMAVSKEFVGEELLMSVLKVAFFLILWFLVGIFILPFFLKKAKRLMNNETPVSYTHLDVYKRQHKYRRGWCTRCDPERKRIMTVIPFLAIAS